MLTRNRVIDGTRHRR